MWTVLLLNNDLFKYLAGTLKCKFLTIHDRLKLERENESIRLQAAKNHRNVPYFMTSIENLFIPFSSAE